MIRIYRNSAAGLLICMCGCALLNADREAVFKPQQTAALRPEQVADFENQTPVRRVVRMQASIATALADDRRIRSGAWEELDESGLMSPEERRRLNESGLRVGVSGGAVPWELSSLLTGQQRSQDKPSSPGAKMGTHTSAAGFHLAIAEGSTSMIELPVNGQTLFIPAGEIAGMMEGAELNNARLLIEMSAVEYGEGWVVIRFLPQIHHGNVTSRYSVSDDGARFPTRQRIQPLYEQQFVVKVHCGETVVIGYQKHADWTIGRMLFRASSLTAEKEHIIAVQLARIEEVTGEKSVTVDYHKY